MISRGIVRLVCVALVVGGCASARPSGDAGLVHLTFLAVSDVYTLEPVDRGRRGGMARLATLVQRVRDENPNTLFLLGGDTLSPSMLSSVLQGRQMIAAFNLLGLDLATFGNHEFDFGPAALSERVRESRFAWLSANVRDRASGRPFGGA